MKFKERLWQLFLVIVLGVTLSVCDAGDSDDDFDENLLTAGTAIASGSSSTSITSGENWVKFGNFMIMNLESEITKTISVDGDDAFTINLPVSYNNNYVQISELYKDSGCSGGFYTSPEQSNSKTNTEIYFINKAGQCPAGSKVGILIIGKYN